MDEINILEGLRNKPAETIAILKQNIKDPFVIQQHREEFYDLNRSIRNSQVDYTQKPKQTPGGKLVPQTQLKVPFQKKIVTVATAFEAGDGVTLTPNEANALSDEIIRLWRVNRLDSKLVDLLITKKVETESAIEFLIEDIDETSAYNKPAGTNGRKEIKTNVFNSKTGSMAPCWDSRGDMIAFIWSYHRNINNKIVNFIEVYDNKNKYILSDQGGDLNLIEGGVKPHGFGKIPIVYLSQDFTEWHDVEAMIDRFETALSKLSDSNDYTGHPFLKLYGEVMSMPQKEDSGKVLRFPVQVKENGKEIKGDAEFLTNNNGPESVKLELEKLEKLINYLTSTPQLSLEDLKGIGSGMSGVSIKLMFMDAIIKAKLNEGDNRTAVERMINVMIAGTVNITDVAMKPLARNTYFDVTFKNILPNDIKETIDYVSSAVGAGVMSKKTGVSTIGAVDDIDSELKLIEEDKQGASSSDVIE